MGICESPNSNKSIKRNKRNLKILSSEPTNITSNEKSISKKSNFKYEKGDYILPEKLSKRDDINKYYKLSSEVLGEGSSGTVCIGEN